MRSRWAQGCQYQGGHGGGGWCQYPGRHRGVGDGVLCTGGLFSATHAGAGEGEEACQLWLHWCLLVAVFPRSQVVFAPPPPPPKVQGADFPRFTEATRLLPSSRMPTITASVQGGV